MSTRTLQFVSGLFVLALAFGCKPKPGGKCLGNASPVCFDPQQALICNNGTYKSLSCRGAKGCTTSATQLDCDNSLATLGDGCNTENDVACQLDKKAALQCKSGKFELAATCKGAHGCASEDNEISCDDHVADLADPCHQNNNYACTSDKKALLQCVDNKFAALDSCKGSNGCRIFELPEEKKTDFSCDETLADENDPCDTDGNLACSGDKKELLSCKSKKYSVLKKCGTCSFDDKGERFACDGAVAGTNAPKAKLTSTAAATTKGGATPAKPATVSAAPKPASTGASTVAAGVANAAAAVSAAKSTANAAPPGAQGKPVVAAPAKPALPVAAKPAATPPKKP
ncbi:MAG TPA: hypothetical protein VGI10_00760 [Polyangiaceae bacterium]